MDKEYKYYAVVLYNGDKEVFRDIVKSKKSTSAITNVLNNKYEGKEPVTRVDCNADKTIAEYLQLQLDRENNKQGVSK